MIEGVKGKMGGILMMIKKALKAIWLARHSGKVLFDGRWLWKNLFPRMLDL